MTLSEFKKGLDKSVKAWQDERKVTKKIDINNIKGDDTKDYGILLTKILEHINTDSTISELTLTDLNKVETKNPNEVRINIAGVDSQKLVNSLKEELTKDGFKSGGGSMYQMTFVADSNQQTTNTTTKTKELQSILGQKLTQMLSPVLKKEFGFDANNIAEGNVENDKFNLLIEDINRIKKLF